MNLRDKKQLNLFSSTSTTSCSCIKAKHRHFRFSAPALLFLKYLTLYLNLEYFMHLCLYPEDRQGSPAFSSDGHNVVPHQLAAVINLFLRVLMFRVFQLSADLFHSLRLTTSNNTFKGVKAFRLRQHVRSGILDI